MWTQTPPKCGFNWRSNGTSPNNLPNDSPAGRPVHPHACDLVEQNGVQTPPPFSPSDLPRSASVPEGLSRSSAARCALKVIHLNEMGDPFSASPMSQGATVAPSCPSSPGMSHLPSGCVGGLPNSGGESQSAEESDSLASALRLERNDQSSDGCAFNPLSSSSETVSPAALRTKLWSTGDCPSDSCVVKQHAATCNTRRLGSGLLHTISILRPPSKEDGAAASFKTLQTEGQGEEPRLRSARDFRLDRGEIADFNSTDGDCSASKEGIRVSL